MVNDLYLWIAIAAVLGAALGNFLGSRRNGAQSAAASAISALQAEIGVLKDSNHRLEVIQAQYKEKVDQLEAHNKLLSNMVQARPEWELIMQAINKQAETSKRLDAMLDAAPKDWQERQERLSEQIQEIHDAVARGSK